MASVDSKVAVRNYFDVDAAGYWDAYSETGRGRGEIFRERRQVVMQMLQEPVGRVLDIGSGPAVFTGALLDRGGECWIGDLSLGMLAVGRDRMASHPRSDRIRYCAGDVERLPYRDTAFDTVLCIGVVTYLHGAETMMQELARVTRPGGQVIVSFQNRRSPLDRFNRFVFVGSQTLLEMLRRFGLKAMPDDSRLTFRRDVPSVSFSPESIEALGSAAGLRPIGRRTHCLNFPFRIPGMEWLLRLWDRAANRLHHAGWLQRWGREAVVLLFREGSPGA